MCLWLSQLDALSQGGLSKLIPGYDVRIALVSPMVLVDRARSLDVACDVATRCGCGDSDGWGETNDCRARQAQQTGSGLVEVIELAPVSVTCEARKGRCGVVGCNQETCFWPRMALAGVECCGAGRWPLTAGRRDGEMMCFDQCRGDWARSRLAVGDKR